MFHNHNFKLNYINLQNKEPTSFKRDKNNSNITII